MNVHVSYAVPPSNAAAPQRPTRHILSWHQLPGGIYRVVVVRWNHDQYGIMRCHIVRGINAPSLAAGWAALCIYGYVKPFALLTDDAALNAFTMLGEGDVNEYDFDWEVWVFVIGIFVLAAMFGGAQ